MDLYYDKPEVINSRKSWTLNYSVKHDAFESYQMFLPDYYCFWKGRFHTLDTDQSTLNRFGVGIKGQYGENLNRPSILKFSLYNPENQPVDYIRLMLSMIVKTVTNIPLDNKFFKFVRFNTEHQDSGNRQTINYNIDTDPSDHAGKISYTLWRDAHRVIVPDDIPFQNNDLGGVPAKYLNGLNYQNYGDNSYGRNMNGRYIIVYLWFDNEYNISLQLDSYVMQIKKQGI